MKFPKLDYKALAMQTAGQAAGLFALKEIAKVKVVANAKPGMKGLIYKAIGVLGPAFLGGKAKKGGELITGLGETLSVAGTSHLMNAFMPGKVPVIGGYEDYPISGPGLEFEEGMDGVEDEYPNGVEGFEEE